MTTSSIFDAQSSHSDAFLTVLIHNNEDDRLPAARQTAGLVQTNLAQMGIRSECIEICEQPDLPMRSLRELVRRDLHWNKIFIESELLRHGKMRLRQPNFVSGRLREFVRHVRLGRLDRSALINSNFALTLKHLKAWALCIEFGFQGIVVLESDAILSETSARRFREVLNDRDLVGLWTGTEPHVASLAGPFSLTAVQGQIRALKETDSARIFWPGFVNTTCAYFMNSAMVRRQEELTCAHPLRALVAVDALINANLQEMYRSRQRATVGHVRNFVVEHGSLTGIVSRSAGIGA